MPLEEHIACLREEDWGKLWQIVKQHTAHVLEGDKAGGFRDRLLLVETSVKDMSKRIWFVAITGGVIGALIGSGSTEALSVFIKWVMKTP